MKISCGLNADWSVQAYYLGEGEPNTLTGQLYVLDNEDETFSLVQRNYSDSDNDEILEYAKFGDLDEAIRKGKELSGKINGIFDPIETLEDGKRFIEKLVETDLLWHFDDDPVDCLESAIVTHRAARVLGKQRDSLYSFDWGSYECPIGYALGVMKK